MIHINYKEKALVDSDTGEIVRPTCWDDLIPYYSYLIGRKHEKMAHGILQEVFRGERVITKMIASNQQRGRGYWGEDQNNLKPCDL